ncbi:prohibitin family protein, partial [Paraburkholderia sp. Se-20369]|nr:prohibitin family protein [Paraburkholderia sp. Se-20369]
MSDQEVLDVASAAITRMRRRLRFFGNDLVIVAVVLVLLVIFLLPSMVVAIPAGHLGVLWKRFGGGMVLDHNYQEGTTVIMPWDVMVIYDARLQSVEEEFHVLSSDGLQLTVTLAWRFRVVPEHLAELHKYVGPNYRTTLVEQSVGSRARDVIALYQPDDIYTSHRLEIQNQIAQSVRYDIAHRLQQLNPGKQDWVAIEDVLIKRIALPPGIEDAIVRKNVARQDVERYALIVEKETQESERKRVEALGIRNFQEIISGNMSDAYLRWRGIEATLELARSENAKVVVIGNGKTGGLPLITIDGESTGRADKGGARAKVAGDNAAGADSGPTPSAPKPMALAKAGETTPGHPP